jgi:hypothetical protein
VLGGTGVAAERNRQRTDEEEKEGECDQFHAATVA